LRKGKLPATGRGWWGYGGVAIGFGEGKGYSNGGPGNDEYGVPIDGDDIVAFNVGIS